MADLTGFDAEKVEPRQEYEPLPAGKYQVVITDSEMKETKAGDGEYLQLTFEVLEGDYKGRKLWARLNLVNPNETAVQIARAELSGVCRALGILRPRDSVELHNLPLLITVRTRKRRDDNELENVIGKYEKIDVLRAQPQQAVNSTPPWRRSS